MSYTESESNGSENLTTGFEHFFAGTVGGILGVVAGHPFDTIKVRLQTQKVVNRAFTHYKNSFDCFLKIIKEEKIFGLYKGMSSPLIGVALMNAFLFGIYGSVLETLHLYNKSIGDEIEIENPNLVFISIAGGLSGFLNSFVSSPVELVKIQLQNRQSKSNVGPFDVFSKIYKKMGIKGCFLGLNSTILRETPSYAAYFFSYEYINRILTAEKSNGETLNWVDNTKLMLSGGLAGALGWISTYPFDVIKTRIQSQDLGSLSDFNNRKYKHIFSSFKMAIQEEGWKVMFRGLTATMIRAFPTNAFIFLGYSYTMDILNKNKSLVLEKLE